MTWAELAALVPPSKHDYAVEIDLDEGPMPSGEEGAEDWITSCSITGVTLDDNRKIAWLEVHHG
jgi:hypothetical protein